ncbi:MAG: hypothetical protein Q8N45_13220 [Anaerolineales bacterium]|nr:hypothetical protein [Anaerolineales bacterium]MDP2977158.1 hypothetical protein [Anaerolineales bacterium]
MDLDFSHRAITVRDEKGEKDRVTDPRSSDVRRQHIHPASLQKAVREATRRTGIGKRISCHTLRQREAPL